MVRQKQRWEFKVLHEHDEKFKNAYEEYCGTCKSIGSFTMQPASILQCLAPLVKEMIAIKFDAKFT